MTSSSFRMPSLKFLLYEYSFILFLVIFPVLIGNSNSGFSIIESQRKSFEINYYSLDHIYLVIDSRYDQASRFKGIKNQKAGFYLLNEIYSNHYDSGLKQNAHYYPLNTESISQYTFKVRFLLLDMPPPLSPV